MTIFKKFKAPILNNLGILAFHLPVYIHLEGTLKYADPCHLTIQFCFEHQYLVENLIRFELLIFQRLSVLQLSVHHY